MNGPGPFSVFTKSAAVSAVASVLKLPASTAVSTMSFALAVVIAHVKASTVKSFFIGNSFKN